MLPASSLRIFTLLLLAPAVVSGWDASPWKSSASHSVALRLAPDVHDDEVGQPKSLAGFYHRGVAPAEEGQEKKKTKAEKECGPECRFTIGCILWLFTPVLLWNNERIAIKQYKMQLKAQRWAVHVNDVTLPPREEMEGRIVYMQGNAVCDETIADAMFPAVRGNQLIKLRREVQMYQWVEKESDNDGKKSYSWYKSWRDGPEDTPNSADKQNPSFPLSSSVRDKDFYRYWSNAREGATSYNTEGSQDACAQAASENVKLGAYYLGHYVTRQFRNKWYPIRNLTEAQLRSCTVPEVAKGGSIVERDGWWYFGGTPQQPQLGDLRVRFEELRCGPVSLCGVLAKTGHGHTLVPVIRKDAGGIGEGFCAEIGGGNCCYREKTIVYGGEEAYPRDEAEFDRVLQDRPRELREAERRSFQRSATSAMADEYDPDDVTGDMCCGSCFGGVFAMIIQKMGLEEEFLAAQEKQLSFDGLMALEGKEAGMRHHAARGLGLLLLLVGSLLILEPALKVLNANFLIQILGGALLSGGLLLLACCCSCGVWIGTMSLAWIAYRPQLAGLALLLVGAAWFCVTNGEIMANVRGAVVPESADKAVTPAAVAEAVPGGAKLFLEIGVAQLRRRPWGF